MSKVGLKVFSLALFLCLLSNSFLTYSQTVLPHQIKSAYLINLIDYFSWENEAESSRYVIGIVGNDEEIFTTLEQALIEKLVKGKAVEIIAANNFDSMRNSHILYVSPSSNFDLHEIAVETRLSSTLIISDNEVEKTHFMLNFLLQENNTISFEINRPNIIYEGLVMNNDILLLGGTELDVAELINAIESEVIEAEFQLEEIEFEFETLQQQSQAQQRFISNQAIIIEEQSLEVSASDKQLEVIESLLASSQEALLLSGFSLSESNNRIKSSQLELDEKNQELVAQSLNIDENNILLTSQEQALSTQAALLVAQSSQVSQQGLIIENYRIWIQASVVAFALFAGLITIILRINKKRIHANGLLASRNSELEQTQYDLQQERDRADTASEAKSRFLTSMSHEIRSPMNAILGYSELLQLDTQSVPQQKKSIDAIQRNGDHLLSIINSVLDMSKIEAGKIEISLESFDFNRLSDDIEIMFKGRAATLGIDLSVEVSDNVPIYVKSDEGKIKQILVNLLSNAVKFTEAGEIELNISCEYQNESQRDGKSLSPKKLCFLCFEVKDTGSGISEKDFETIFGAFEQTVTGKNTINGTGLGLSISRYYARLLGGDISLRSEVNIGSTFTCCLPVETISKPVPSAHLETEKITGIKNSEKVYKILVVDDKAENRDLLKQMLALKNFLIKEVVNGKEAIALYKQWQPNLILMDLSMPVMDGTEATRIIKSLPNAQDCRIVAVTANVFEEQRKDILNAGANGYIRKPFTKNEILMEIAEQLNFEYCYEKTGNLNSFSFSSSDMIFEQLKEAAVALDVDRIRSIIEAVEVNDQALADHVRVLIENYEFEQIEELVSSY